MTNGKLFNKLSCDVERAGKKPHSEHRFLAPSKDVVNQYLEFGKKLSNEYAQTDHRSFTVGRRWDRYVTYLEGEVHVPRERLWVGRDVAVVSHT